MALQRRIGTRTGRTRAALHACRSRSGAGRGVSVGDCGDGRMHVAAYGVGTGMDTCGWPLARLPSPLADSHCAGYAGQHRAPARAGTRIACLAHARRGRGPFLHGQLVEHGARWPAPAGDRLACARDLGRPGPCGYRGGTQPCLRRATPRRLRPKAADRGDPQRLTTRVPTGESAAPIHFGRRQAMGRVEKYDRAGPCSFCLAGGHDSSGRALHGPGRHAGALRAYAPARQSFSDCAANSDGARVGLRQSRDL